MLLVRMEFRDLHDAAAGEEGNKQSYSSTSTSGDTARGRATDRTLDLGVWGVLGITGGGEVVDDEEDVA